MTASNLPDLTLRRCEPGDIPAITAIYADSVLHGLASFELDPPSEDEMTVRWRALLSAGYPYLVAEQAGAILAYAYASPYRPRPAYGGTVENSVYVRKDCQGKGIGSLLLQRLIAEAETAGFRQMVAVIGDSANTGSIRLHERLGFRLVGTLRSVGWKHRQWLDTVLMQRTLGDGDLSPR